MSRWLPSHIVAELSQGFVSLSSGSGLQKLGNSRVGLHKAGKDLFNLVPGDLVVRSVSVALGASPQREGMAPFNVEMLALTSPRFRNFR